MIISSDAGIFKLTSRLIGELPEGDANFHAELFHITNNVQDRFKLSLSLFDPFPSGSHTKASRPGVFGVSGFRENRLPIHQTFRLHPGIVAGTLGAVAAVLAASPGLNA